MKVWHSRQRAIVPGICEAQEPKILISVDMEGIGALVKDQFGPSAFDYLPWVKRPSGKTILVESDKMVDLNHFITALFAINRRR